MSGSTTPIRLVMGASAWSNWTRYDIDSDFVTPADSWSFEVHNPTALQLAALVTGVAVTLQVGTATVLRGVLERKTIRRSKGSGTVITVGGRDLSGPLVDCAPPSSWSFVQTPLATVAQAALTELGISATVTASAEATAPRAHIKAEPGETYWQVLERVAKKLRLMLWMAPEGVLHIGRPDYTSPPVGVLLNSSTAGCNVLEAAYSDDLAGRFTDVTVLGQVAGSDDAFGASAAQVKGTAQDTVLRARGLYRPTTLDDGDVESTVEAKARAAWEVSQRQYEATQLQYVVAGHGPSAGVLWAPNQQVTVVDELVGTSGVWWISSRRFTRDIDSGTRTELVLRPPNLLLPAVA